MNTFDDGNNNDNNNNNNSNNNNDNASNSTHPSKKGKGRQKIAMVKIQNDTNLQVTFSKRRAGVFKKASELSTLCGAESAVVVFSPGNKPHSFGHPNVETVANRFLQASSGEAPPRTTADHLIMAQGEAAMQQRNHELVALEAELERERHRRNELSSQRPPPPPLDGLDYEQLNMLKHSVLGFKRELEAKVKNAATLPYATSFGNPNAADALAFGSGSGSGSRAANYGYTVHYPPIGGGGSSSEPAAVVPYEGGTGSSDPDNDGFGYMAAPRDDGGNQFQGYGGNYQRPDQF